MNRQTSVFTRAVFALVLGYMGVIVTEWFVLKSTPIGGQTKLLLFGVLFIGSSAISFAVITVLEIWARKRDLPVSAGITVLYQIATLGLLFGGGATVAYWTVERLPSYRSLVLPISTVTGILVAVVGGYLLYRSVDNGKKLA